MSRCNCLNITAIRKRPVSLDIYFTIYIHDISFYAYFLTLNTFDHIIIS